jgi:hypothetical protein
LSDYLSEDSIRELVNTVKQRVIKNGKWRQGTNHIWEELFHKKAMIYFDWRSVELIIVKDEEVS